jgi:hypothetical protein
MTTLREFLDARRVQTTMWNITGLSVMDRGKYCIQDEEYDIFLNHVYNHLFGGLTPNPSSLMERHRQFGPILIDLEFRYDAGTPVIRSYTDNHIRNFLATYLASMMYFSKLENLQQDLYFYQLAKPGPEMGIHGGKDGVHLHCPNLTTSPMYQYAIRGFLLSNHLLDIAFAETIHTPEHCFSASVLKNNWFLYGAGKPDKPNYTITNIWKISLLELQRCDTTNYATILGTALSALHKTPIPTDAYELMKILSIRRGHTVETPLAIRENRTEEWAKLIAEWGNGNENRNRNLGFI